jgi:serine/threonine-protein kinase
MVAVPDVAGRTEQAAGALLRSAGLNPLPSYATSSTVPSGLVISQTPAAGARAAKHSQVTIVVSGGAASAPLPNVGGLTQAEALQHLTKAGFKPTPRPQSSSSVTSGLVIETNPPAGTDDKLGSPVTVLVSSGPEPVRVPDVKGQTLSVAEGELTSVGLKVGTVTKRTTKTQASETVLSETPSAGKSVKAGTSVSLTIAEAPPEVAIPNVVGETQAAAEATLKRANFKAKTVTATTTEASQVGVVLRQTPGAGTEATKGSLVTIAVGVLGPTTTSTTTTITTPTTSTPSGGG